MIKSIGDALKKARGEESMTQSELASTSQVSERQIRRIENHECRNPGMRTLQLLAIGLERELVIFGDEKVRR